MAYRLKEIRFHTRPCHILLQNENGPCPLLAAANVLLLKGSISLPSNCIGAGVVTIEQLLNVLAEKITDNKTPGSDHHIQEVMTIFPSLQFGMDVNPKFTEGPTGTEYTLGLNAFDLLHIEMVHGWLIDPQQEEEYNLIRGKTYNQLVNSVIEGNDASAEISKDHPMMDDAEKVDELTIKANGGKIIHNFLEQSSHQLTQYGLTTLHEYLKDGQMAVFFRNNHFNTMIKYQDNLYLLVTDIGYASVSNIIWEKLDVIDGDTEYVADNFKPPPPMKHSQVSAAATGEQLVANSKQSEADLMLAMQLSQETARPTSKPLPPQSEPNMEAARQASLGDGNSKEKPTVAVGIPAAPMTDEERDHMIAVQMQKQQEREEEIRRANQTAEDRDRMVAEQIQKEQEREDTIRRENAVAAATTTGAPLVPPQQHQQQSLPFEVARGAGDLQMSNEEKDRMIALQLQKEQEREDDVRRQHLEGDAASAALAQQLYQQELQRAQTAQSRIMGQQQQQHNRGDRPANTNSSNSQNCVIS